MRGDDHQSILPVIIDDGPQDVIPRSRIHSGNGFIQQIDLRIPGHGQLDQRAHLLPKSGVDPPDLRHPTVNLGPAILLQHLIPNAMGSILVTATMLIPSAIFMEAFLGYLGIGLRSPLASLGTMCNDAAPNLQTSPHQLLFPALMICLIMFGFNFIGDGLRDALDPKLKK